MKNLQKQFCPISLSLDPTLVSTVVYKSSSYLTMPVNILVGDIVVQPMNSGGQREFVPLAELAKNPGTWNGTHILTDHPGPDNGNSMFGTACTADILDQLSFGTVFNSRMHEGKIKATCYLDIDRAAEMGGHAQNVIDRINDGEQIELSAGTWRRAQDNPGISPSGEEYDVTWYDIGADHLALLPKGKTGCCSNKDTCGGPRLNSELDRNNTDTVNTVNTAKKGQVMKTEIASRLFKLLGVGPDEMSLILRTMQDPTDDDVRTELFRALRNQPGFDWILEVKATTKKKSVVYRSLINDRVEIFEYKFTLNADDTVTLTGSPVPGKMGFIPDEDEVATASTASTTTTASRNDLGNQLSQTCDCDKGEGKMSEPTREVKDLASSLIEEKVFDKGDETFLHGCTVEKLGKFKADLVKSVETVPATTDTTAKPVLATTADAKPVPATTSTPDTATTPVVATTASASPPVITSEAILAAFPKDVLTVLKNAQKAAEEKKDSLVGRLSNCGQDKFTKEQLEKMDLAALEDFDAFLPKPAVSFANRPVPTDSKDYEPPDPYKADLEKLQLSRAN